MYINKKQKTMTHKIGLYLLIGLMTLAFSACSDDDDNGADPTPPGEHATFTLTMSGDLEGTLGGLAIFGEISDPETEEDMFFISLVADEGGTSLGFFKLGGRPATTTYPIEGLDFEDLDDDLPFGETYFMVTMNTMHMDQMHMFASDEGSIAFDESSGNALSGVFDFTASGYSVEEPLLERNIVINGSFHAIEADDDPPLPGK